VTIIYPDLPGYVTLRADAQKISLKRGSCDSKPSRLDRSTAPEAGCAGLEAEAAAESDAPDDGADGELENVRAAKSDNDQGDAIASANGADS
jgi:hypothetical protein